MADQRSTPNDADPVEQKIRQLQQYAFDDEEADSSVRIQALPGSIVNVSAPESDPPIVRKSKTAKVLAAVAGALVSIGLVAKAIWDAAH